MKLKKGDKIGIFSPSMPITKLAPKRFLRGKEFLENKGFEIVCGSLTNKADYYRSGSIKERADELNNLIRDPEIKCIMSTIGGSNSNSLLPYIDYEAFKKNPKIIIGYSDVTAILFSIYVKTGISTYYGPAIVASFGELDPFNEMTYKYFKEILIDEPVFFYKYEKPKFWTEEYINWEDQTKSKTQNKNSWTTLKEGKAQGRLIAGNLNTMSGFWGSEYMPKIKKGDILMIEDSLKDPAIVEKNFAMLKVNRVFENLGGLILGKHELFDDKGTKRETYEILEEVLNKYDFPLMVDVDCGHTHPMFTMPIGAQVEIDTKNQEIKILKDWNK